MKIHQVIIVGAGPAGLFAALELAKNGLKDVLILEKGQSIDKRQRQETMYGVGGGGTFSDGKLHFSMTLSQERLLDFGTKTEAMEWIDEVENSFLSFGVNSPVTPTNEKEVERLISDCHRCNVKLYTRRVRHVGSDLLPSVIGNLVTKLKENKVVIEPKTEVMEITKKKGVFRLQTNRGVFKTKILLIAPGRVGAKWLQNIAKDLGISYEYQMVEIGVRYEFPASVTAEHARIMYEGIYSIQTPTFDDTIRTYCPCPNGYVSVEDYGNYVCVNGHSNSKNDSKNSNFAFVQEVRLTKPVENTTDYAISIAKLATTLGGGKPIIQRLADLKAGRRSTPERIFKSLVVPTLSLDLCTPGDISMALPYRLVKNILEALDILNGVLPGINAGWNFLYAPEIKLRGSRIRTNKFLETELAGLFVAGDGAGVSGNIVGAAATGIIAARGIAKSIK